jgi:superfamily II DNA or RNA helicase
LATGFGKSFLLGLLAEHLNTTTGKKVLVVVPTPFLQLYQESNYCPTASKIPGRITDPNAPNIFYCSYEAFMSFVVPPETIVLVDEFHELFFNQLVGVVNGRFVSVMQKLATAFKVIGVSATFRGDAGVDKIKTILSDSNFI